MNVPTSQVERPASRARPRGSPPSSDVRVAGELVRPEMRRDIIAQGAYFRAQQRNFERGHELEDWLAAEAEVDAALSLEVPPSGA
jgi:Protein of unknown function (DUF2934)